MEYVERVLDAGRLGDGIRRACSGRGAAEDGPPYDEHVLDAGRPGGWNTTSVFWARGGRGRTALLPVKAFRKAVEILAAGSCYDDQVLDTNATKPQRIQSRLNR